MKAKPSLLFSVLLISCAIGQVVYGQYAPHSSPANLPLGAYGGQFVPAYPASPPAGYPGFSGQMGPVMPAPQFAMPQANWADQASFRNAEGERPSFRVMLAGDDERVPLPQNEVALASTLVKQYKAARHSHKDDGKGGKKDDSCYGFRVFGEYLYFRARDAEVAYAVEANSGVGPPPIQVSPIAVLDQGFSSGFRAGFAVCMDDCSELVATYSFFESASVDQIVSNPPITQIVSMVIHPATPNAVIGTAAATGAHDIDFDLIDLDYRRAWWDDDLGNLNWVVGLRGGQLEQNFSSVFTDSLVPPVINEVAVSTDIDFSGVGLHLGVEGERYATRLPFLVYAKCSGSLMAGEFDASYQQTVQAGANFGVNTSWTAGRIVPTFDLELGTGFFCCNGSLRATAGYLFSAWTNVVKTEDFIHAVQTNDFRDMNDTMTFDGLVVRVEGRF